MFALFAGACFLLAWMAAANACRVSANGWPAGEKCSFLKFAFDWQSLLAGLFAILAAGIGWVAISRQVRWADEQEQARVRRQHAAARAMLPLALAGLSDYQCVEALLPLYTGGAGERIFEPEGGWPRPEVPASPMEGLRAMVEAAIGLEGKAIATLLARLQVQASRLRSLAREFRRPETTVVRSNIEQYIVDTVELQARADALFLFARGDGDHLSIEVEPSEQRINSAAFSLGLYPGRFQGITDRIGRQYGPDRALNGDTL